MVRKNVGSNRNVGGKAVFGYERYRAYFGIAALAALRVSFISPRVRGVGGVHCASRWARRAEPRLGGQAFARHRAQHQHQAGAPRIVARILLVRYYPEDVFKFFRSVKNTFL